MSDLVSIITPAFNARECLSEAVQSAIAQTYDNWEMLIVADDACDYQSLLGDQHIRDERLRFFSSPAVHSGPNIARNVALAQARGEWIAPLDADDIYYPDRLARLLELGARRGLALDNVNITGTALNERRVIEPPFPEVLNFEDFKICLVPLLFLFHKSHITRGWDEDITRGADTIFNLRALESAGGADFYPRALHEYRVHNASMCHAHGAEEIFVEAYAHTLQRLRIDGLGFQQEAFRQQVIDLIEEKREINEAFLQAKKKGFTGNYQSFVEAGRL